MLSSLALETQTFREHSRNALSQQSEFGRILYHGEELALLISAVQQPELQISYSIMALRILALFQTVEFPAIPSAQACLLKRSGSKQSPTSRQSRRRRAVLWGTCVRSRGCLKLGPATKRGFCQGTKAFENSLYCKGEKLFGERK